MKPTTNKPTQTGGTQCTAQRKSGFIASIRRLLTSLSESLFPRQCTVCRQRLTPDEHALCTGCLMSLPMVRHASYVDNPMVRTFWHLLPVERGTAGFYYNRYSASKRLFYAFKYHHQPHVARDMGAWLAQQLLSSGFFNEMDLILPVPLTPLHRLKRGYNQSEQLARGIASVTGLPIDAKCLIRKGFSRSQTRLHRNERTTNVKGTIRCTRHNQLKNKHILLVDDVMTTGATLLACGEALKDIEGVRISILTLGLTQKSASYAR